jgi:hypothetical protein
MPNSSSCQSPALRRICMLLFPVLLCLPYTGFAQTPNLSFLNNYFVAGDHIVRDFNCTQCSGPGANGYINGTIQIPSRTYDLEGVPDGAEVVAAFLYWQVLEPMAPPSPDPGSSALFNGYAITGDPVGSDQGACGDENQFVRSYRADVLPYLPVVNVNGNKISQAAATHNVGLPPNPSGNSSLPVASLVIVYRVLSGAPWAPLKATVIYDGSTEVVGPVHAFSLSLPMGGFYDGVYSSGTDLDFAKVTDISVVVAYNGSAASFLSYGYGYGHHYVTPLGVTDQRPHPPV